MKIEDGEVKDNQHRWVKKKKTHKWGTWERLLGVTTEALTTTNNLCTTQSDQVGVCKIAGKIW